ncbi:MAG TPA: diadenylate cyclase [Blastocatellia bacterium]|nr:diadenylate cyclase [Blastocatellia bacterium]
MFETIQARTDGRYNQVLEPAIELAIEIAREGREGRRIGTIFTIGDAAAVIERSRSLILDPLTGHSEAVRHITNANLRGTLKELAQLDGAFVISDEGIVVSACRYLDATVSDVELPLGLGSRHFAAASISRVTGAIAVVVSESAMVRVFDGGNLIAEVLPELWLLSRYSVQLRAPFSEEHFRDLAVLVSQPRHSRTETTPGPEKR